MSFLRRLFNLLPSSKEIPKTCVYKPDHPEYMGYEFTIKPVSKIEKKIIYQTQSTQITPDPIVYSDIGVLANSTLDKPERNVFKPLTIIAPPSPVRTSRVLTPKSDTPRISFQRTSASTKKTTSVQSRGFIYRLGLNEEKMEEKPKQEPEKSPFSFEIKKPKDPFKSFNSESSFRSQSSSSPELDHNENMLVNAAPVQIPSPELKPIIIDSGPKYTSHFVISKKPSDQAPILMDLH